MGQVLEAKESFTTELDGKKIHIVAGATRVDEAHELAKRFPQHFKGIEASFGVEAATDAPGEVRARVAAASESGAASVSADSSEGDKSSSGSGSSSSEPAGDPGTRKASPAAKRSTQAK